MVRERCLSNTKRGRVKEKRHKEQGEAGDGQLLVLSSQSVLQVAQAFLLGQQLLSLFLDFSLHLELNLTQLVLLTTQLLLLETNALVCQLVARNGRVRIVAVHSARELSGGQGLSESQHLTERAFPLCSRPLTFCVR